MNKKIKFDNLSKKKLSLDSIRKYFSYLVSLKTTLFLFLFLILCSSLISAEIELHINEEGKIISYYDQYYIYQLNGTITVHNPTIYDTHNIELPYYLSTLFLRTENNTPEYFMTSNKIYLHMLEANSSHTFKYKLIGISSEDLSTNGESILSNGIVQLTPKIYSQLFGTLKKAPIEDSSYTGRDARLISVEFRNPTNFNYTLANVDVIKTTENDPNAAIKTWSFEEQKNELTAFEGWDFDFIDEDPTEGEIYWLATDVFIDTISMNQSANISRYDQDDLLVVLSNATLNQSVEENLTLLGERIYLRKYASLTAVNPGEIVDMSVIVNNLQPKMLKTTIHDTIPEGFSVIEVEEGVAEENNLTWDVEISSGTAKRLNYKLKYLDEDSLGLDYFKPAYLLYEGTTYYSQAVPFVRKYLPKERVFVQKNVKFLTGDEAQITISVQNLGESEIKNVVLKEHLLSSAEFREITVAPKERGVWDIEEIKQGQLWEVTYVTNRASVLNTMPELFGVKQSSVLQTIILSNLITTSFSSIPTNMIEVISIIILVILAALYFLPANVFSRKRKKQMKELNVIHGELRSLKKDTNYQHSSLYAPSKPAGGLSNTSSSIRKSIVSTQNLQDPRRKERHHKLDDNAAFLQDSKNKISGEEKNNAEKNKLEENKVEKNKAGENKAEDDKAKKEEK